MKSKIEIPNLNVEIIAGFAKLMQIFNPEKKDYFFERIFTLLKLIVPFDYATIFMLEHEKKKIELVAKKGRAVDLIELVTFEFGKGFSAWIAKEKKSIMLNNLHKNERETADIMRSFLSVPLILESDLIGVINFGSDKANTFSDEMVNQLKYITPIISAVLSRNLAVDKIQRQNQEILKINENLRLTQEELIQAQQKAAITATIVSLNHEINNPLMIITGNIQMLQERQLDPDIMKRINIIEKQIDRISDIIAKLREIEAPVLEQYIDDDGEEQMLKLDT